MWENRAPGVRPRDGFKKSVNSEARLAKYYFSNTRDKRFLLWVTGLVFFYWVFYNYRSLKRLKKLDKLDALELRYMRAVPIGISLVFMLNLAPLFDLHAPAIYIESTQFILMLVLTTLFYSRLPRGLFILWCVFIALFLLLSGTRILGLPLYLQRWWTFSLNAASAAFGVFVLVRLRNFFARYKAVLFVAGLYIFFNLLAVVCNLFGRVTLSQLFSNTAVYAFAQVVSLAVFIRLVTEAFLLQVAASRVRKKYPDDFEFTSIINSVRNFALVIALLLWLVVFTTNLTIYNTLTTAIGAVLTTPRDVGSFSFTLGGVLLFLGIIWVANFLQKYIAYFFGDLGDDTAIDNRGQRSRLLVTRLILLIAGFLLAVAASGLPMDKITVILGALGVGIGLGLQGIVNNFVSGIILIFDRPLRIGDTVEIGDKKGMVKEIGVRSSTLLTDEGAEVIIPNGDMLAHNIVNWTLSNNHVRSELTFTLEKPVNLTDVHAWIKEIVLGHAQVLTRREPDIIIDQLNQAAVEVKVFFWCKDISKAALTRSEIRAAIYERFDQQHLKAT